MSHCDYDHVTYGSVTLWNLPFIYDEERENV